jgi:hypothetical protein
LDHCGGSGDLARKFMALEPGVRVALTDINPDPAARDLYATDMSLDAKVLNAVELGLRLSGARALISNPPFARRVNSRIVAAGLELLRQHRIEFTALMAKTNHALDSAIGFRETKAEPLFVGAIACMWRTVLFEPTSESKRGKFAHSWLVWTRTGRGRLDSGSYSVICWYGPFPIAPLIQFGGSSLSPQASRARRQPR